MASKNNDTFILILQRKEKSQVKRGIQRPGKDYKSASLLPATAGKENFQWNFSVKILGDCPSWLAQMIL